MILQLRILESDLDSDGRLEPEELPDNCRELNFKDKVISQKACLGDFARNQEKKVCTVGCILEKLEGPNFLF